MDELTDAELLERFRGSGDRSALDALARRYMRFVYGTARREFSAHAEDITQAVFLLLARKASSVPRHRIGGWLFRATRYCAATARRSEGRRIRHELGAAGERSEVAIVSEPSDSLIPLLNDAIADMNTADREAIVLRYLQGAEVSRVANALGVSEEAARKRITRAVEKLRQSFARKGITAAATPAIVAALVLEAGKPAPATTVAAASAAILSPASAGAVASSLSIGAAKMMVMTKLKLIAVVLLACTLLAGLCEQLTRRAVASAPPATAPAAVTQIDALTKRFADAGTITVTSHAQTTEAGQKANVTATLYVASNDRIRVALKMDQGAAPGNRMLLILNGKQAAVWMNGQRMPQNGPTESGSTFTGYLARLGVAGSILNAREVPAGQPPPAPDVEKDLPISELKEATAPIDGVAKPAITYTLGGPFFPQSGHVTLWLDPATGLPIRREITTGNNGQGRVVTETYSDWKLGAAIDPALFDLEKGPTSQP